MVWSIRRRLARFVAHERGNVAITFGLSAIPLVLVTGGAIDYSRAATQWSNLQQATDATALSTAHTYLSSTSTAPALKTYAQNYISGLMNNTTVTNVVLSQTNTQVCVYTSFVVPTVFMKIAGINQVTTSTSACSQVGHTYEVAVALDNSGSMQESAGGQSKIQAVQAAAKQLVGILIPSGTSAPQVAISLVPFTTNVNVGTSRSASFLDTTGSSSIHWQNFHRPSGTPWMPTSKFDLFDSLGTAWGGCVEELPPPYTATDQPPASAADAKFVPYFAPDDPGDYSSHGGSSPPNGVECYPAGSNCMKQVPPYIFLNSYISDAGSATTAGNCGSSSAYANADNATDGSNVYPGSSETMVCKYKGASTTQGSNAYLGPVLGATIGPNWLCNAQQLTPLTTSTTTLNAAINTMTAQGSTNLVAGLMWAWRTLSPKVNAFPTSSTNAIGPQNPKAYSYGPPPNTKIIILMTDGTNTFLNNPFSPWQSDYESFGYYSNNRLASYLSPAGIPGASNCSGSSTNSGNARCLMDNATLDACQNAKSAGVVIYTIGFSIPSDPIDSDGLNLLQTCATAPYSSHFFKAADSTSIQTAFQQIAASILSLRLSQ